MSEIYVIFQVVYNLNHSLNLPCYPAVQESMHQLFYAYKWCAAILCL